MPKGCLRFGTVDPPRRGFIIRQVSQRQDGITIVEQALFEELKGEFTDELENSEISISDKEQEPHLIQTGPSEKRLIIDGRLEQRTAIITGPGHQNRNRTVIGIRSRGRYKKAVAFFGEARLRNVRGVGPVDITIEQTRGLLPSIDERNTQNFKLLGSLLFRYKWFRFDLGRGLNPWGPALRVSTIVSDQMPPVLRYKFITSFWGLIFTYFHSFLINDGSGHVPGYPLAIPKRRYWAGHRLDFHFGDHVRFAAMETIVYGNRGLEQLYWFPVTTNGT